VLGAETQHPGSFDRVDAVVVGYGLGGSPTGPVVPPEEAALNESVDAALQRIEQGRHQHRGGEVGELGVLNVGEDEHHVLQRHDAHLEDGRARERLPAQDQQEQPGSREGQRDGAQGPREPRGSACALASDFASPSQPRLPLLL
jgi:hypothetical protein